MNLLRCVVLLVGLIFGGCQCPPVRPPQAWQQLATGTKASLRGLSAVDNNVAVVGGSNGTLLRTLDGGQTWTDIAPPSSQGCDFRDVEALDRDHLVAMVAGQPARVYRSMDGGSSWRITHEDPRKDAFFDAMAFAGDYGVMFGDAIDGQFCLLETWDAGCTWRDRSSELLPEPMPGEAAFAASGTCLVVADIDEPAFLLVTGGGPSRGLVFGPGLCSFEAKPYWAKAMPMQTGSSSKGAFSAACRGAVMVAVGGDYQDPPTGKGTVSVSLDFGESWWPGDAGGFRSAVVWLDEQALVAVGSHGASWSADEGRTWTSFGTEGFHTLSKARDGTVWAAGSDGRVAKLLRAR